MGRRWLTSFLAVALFAFPSTATAGNAVCGNGVVEGVEECDDGDATAASGQSCRANCTATMCGKPTGSAGPRPSASDALFTLRSAVGSSQCDACVCDANGNGGISATDALTVLRSGVGQPVPLICGSCFDIRRKGRLSIRHRIEVAEIDRKELLSLSKQIQAEGYTVADDGSFVLSPARAAKGWPVVFGGQRVETDVEGNFEIEIEAGDSVRGTIAHPQQTDEPIYAVNIAHLTPLDQTTVPLDFLVAFAGPCGMHEEKELPDPPQCTDIALPVEGLSSNEGHEHGKMTSTTAANDGGDGAGVTDPVLGTTTGPLGLYPAGNQTCCRDYDGYIPSTTRGTSEHYIAFFGSTCKIRVDQGCCSGERGTVTNIVLDKLDIVRVKGCVMVHHGRLCQELAPGEVAVGAAGVIAKKGETKDATVHLGSANPVVVHNNGCFGSTSQAKTEEQLFGILEGPNLAGGIIKHFQGNSGPYFADRTLTYTLARCVGSVAANEHDTYTWRADGEGPTLRFVRSNVQLYKFLPDGPIFSNVNAEGWVVAGIDQCDSLHVHGLHPCNGAPEPVDAGPCGHGKVAAVVVP